MFHVDGTCIVADLLTKQHIFGVKDVSERLTWQTGNPWMRLETEKMQLKAYSNLTVPQNIEDQVRPKGRLEPACT